MPADIQAEYIRLKERAAQCDAGDNFMNMSGLFADREIWKSYQWLLNLVPRSVDGCDAVDIGCKYGHLMPLLFAQGARSAIGVDVIDEYLAPAARIVGGIYPKATFKKSENGYLPIEANSVDLVIVNEVISHINPGFLPVMYSEIARTLRPGGHVLISDGNNIANAECRNDLINVYDAWENGPPGRNTGRDVVDEPFVELRRRLIRSRHPELPADRVDYAALNTSGLFGDYFRTVIDRFAAGEEFVARPYRRGDCPINPSDGGMVMEFGFFPQQVEMALDAYGIHARQLFPPPQLNYSTMKQLLGTGYVFARYHLYKLFWPEFERGASWGFQILGVKER